MEALTQIAPALDTAALLARVHVAPDSEDAAAFTALIDQAREVARPKALYAEAFVEGRGDDTIRIDGITFTSRMLRRKLGNGRARLSVRRDLRARNGRRRIAGGRCARPVLVGRHQGRAASRPRAPTCWPISRTGSVSGRRPG